MHINYIEGGNGWVKWSPYISCFYSGYNAPTLSLNKNNRRDLQHVGCVVLSMHITYYTPRSGFPLYNLTPADALYK